MVFLHKTKGGAPINGKQLIFVHATVSDNDDRDRVIKMILDSENGGDYAVLYNDDEAFPVDFKSPELSRINLYVPIITKEYLEQCGRDMDYSQMGTGYGFAILPVVHSSEDIPAFNERFKDIHAITLTMKDPALEIEKLLSRMLVSSKLIEEIVRDAFTRRLFLSYRKKDKAEVERIMRAVHNTKWGKAAAIWFDDFLVPGTDFKSGINQAMKEADAVVFAVTKNLPKPNAEGMKNYVCEHEYPDAVKLGKETIAVEAEPTSRRELDDALGKSFPECVPIDDAKRMNAAFAKLGGAEPKPDPYVQYLRAMAYLIGVRVERDPEKAIKMLKTCVDNKVPEAAMQLSKMYAEGKFVSRDEDTAVSFRQKAFDIVSEMPLSREKVDWYINIVLGFGVYEGVSIGNDPDDADGYYERAIGLFESYMQTASYASDKASGLDLNLYTAEAFNHLGDINNRYKEQIKNNIPKYEKELRKAKEILSKNEFDTRNRTEYLRIAAMNRALFAHRYRFEDMYPEALKSASEAIAFQQELIKCDTSFDARWALAIYKNEAIGCGLLINGRFGTASEKKVRDCIRDYEKLYAEKKDPVIAVQMIRAYRNLRTTTHSAKRAKKYAEEAYKRCKEVQEDYPYENDLSELAVKLRDPGDATMRITHNHLLLLITLINLWLGFYAAMTFGKPRLIWLALVLAGGVNFAFAWFKPIKHLKRSLVVSCIALVISLLSMIFHGGFTVSSTDGWFCCAFILISVLL